MTKYFITFFLFYLPLIGQAQIKKQTIPNDNLMKTTLDTVVQNQAVSFMEDKARVGLSIGIFKVDKSFTYNYGSIQKGKQILPTNKTIYEIGSISKTFTGTLLAQAVTGKKVKMDDDIRLYMNDSYPNLEYQGQPIKLSHLLSHISGLPNLLPDIPNLFGKTNPDSLPFVITRIQNNYSQQKFFADLHKVKLDTVPGYNFSYSNSGAQLLKYILERVYKKTYAELLNTYILQPLKMKSTNSTLKNIDSKKIAKGYNNKGKLMPYNPPMLVAAGGIYSTTSDMLKYLEYHLNEENEVVTLSHKPVVGDIADYAVGLNWQEILTEKKHRKIWQSGGTFGFSTYCVIYPEQKIGIILLTNEADRNAQRELDEIADRIFENLLK
jgi:serine-type D-Ala-D-Ala carboxypeptidase/endopeptidase